MYCNVGGRFALLLIELSRTYSLYEWREDIKRIMRRSTESELHGVFLFTDTQIKQEAFLEDINNLLNRCVNFPHANRYQPVKLTLSCTKLPKW